MTTPKIVRIISFALMLTVTIPASSAIVVPVTARASTTTIDDPRAQQLLQRLQNIKAMDKSDLSRSEKRSLRKEVKDIRKEMKTIKGGVYLSVAAIIIIILLLILLL